MVLMSRKIVFIKHIQQVLIILQGLCSCDTPACSRDKWNAKR